MLCLLSSPLQSEAKGLDMKDVDVPVVGGHAGATILPLLSQVRCVMCVMRFCVCSGVHRVMRPPCEACCSCHECSHFGCMIAGCGM